MSRWVESLDRRQLLSAVSSLQNAWTTIGNGPAHTSYVAGSTGGLTASESWSVTTGSRNSITGHPLSIAVGGGRVYVTRRIFDNEPQKIMALDPSSGQVLWTRDLPTSYGLNPPTYYDGRLYVQWAKSYENGSKPLLYALDAKDGSTIWSAPFAAQWEDYLAPAVDSTGIWIDGGGYGGIYGFGFDGAQIMFHSLAQVEEWSPSLSGGYVYAYSGTGLGKYDAAGNLVWQYYVPHETGVTYAGGPQNMVTIGPDLAYITADNGLRAIDLTTGTVRWIDTTCTAHYTPALANGVLYVETDAGTRAYRASDGTLLRTFAATRANPAPNQLTYDVASPPIVTDDALITESDTATLIYNLDGTLRQSIPLVGSTALDHGTLYINTRDGVLHAFNFGAAMRGTIFNDTNANGVQDAGETGSNEATAGVYLDLDDSGTFTAGDVLAGNADAGGRVNFNVSAGTYTARLVLPSGAVATTPTSAQVAVVDGVAASLPAFGISRTYSISGVTRNDYDANGAADHCAAAGITVYADLNHNNALDAGEPSTTSDANGAYTLELPAGQYYLRQTSGDGSVETGRLGGPDANFGRVGIVQVGPGKPGGSYDLLSRPAQTLVVTAYNAISVLGKRPSDDQLSTAANFVFIDLNANGIYDAGEPNETASNGVSAFAVAPGTYTVRMIAGNAVRTAKPTDSVQVTVGAGTIARTQFNLLYGQSVTGTAFNDANGNGTQDAGESAFTAAGPGVYIDTNNDGLYTTGEPTATLAGTGTFTFANLPVGTWTLRTKDLVANNLAQTSPAGGLTFTVAAGQTVAAGAFGLQTAYTFTLAAYTDQNANGLFDSGEVLQTGRTIFADLNNNGTPDAGEPTASASGTTYTLTLPVGTYTLRQVLPTNTRETGRNAAVAVSGSTFATNALVRVPADVPSGQTLYFGSKAMATVNVSTYFDVNGNGLIDGTETRTALGGFVYLDQNNNGVYDTGDLVPSTSANGISTFYLSPGNYLLRQSLDRGWAQSFPSFNGATTVRITSTTVLSSPIVARWQPPTRLQSVTIDNGAAQRSRVRTLTLTFGNAIRADGIGTGAFSLTQLSGEISSWTLNVQSVVALAGGGTTLTLAFAGPGLTAAGSLVNGSYRLTIDGSKLTDVNGFAVDAANTGTRGSVRQVNFFRLSSDANGDGTVNFNDFLMLQNAFGTTLGAAGFVDGLDSDNNGAIDFNDFLALQNDFGSQVPAIAPALARVAVKRVAVRRVR